MRAPRTGLEGMAVAFKGLRGMVGERWWRAHCKHVARKARRVEGRRAAQEQEA